jgi:hypothetical protein
VLKEYREKSKEFEKATKKSRQSYNAFDKDVKALNKRIQQLELEKKKVERGGPGGKNDGNMNAAVEKLEKDWAMEKEKLEK